jgi:signal transduction histidine kinase
MVIQIIDNGPGISSDVLEKIFIPFYTTKEKGSGIGLSLCRQIMRLHNGSISVSSIKNKQTIFTLRF